MKKCIVTVVGKDTVGIIAKVCTYLAESKINILDISQTIVQGYFNMMMVVDISEIEKDFKVICDEMEQMGEEDRGKDPVPERREFLKRCTDYKNKQRRG